MTIRKATTAMGTFYYLVEDVFFGSRLGRGIAWEYKALERIKEHFCSRRPGNIIDVGAHIGTHTIPYARWVRDHGCVYAFEPQPVMLDLLRKNVAVNDCSEEVVIFDTAVGHIDNVKVSMEDVIVDGPNAGQPYQYKDGEAFNYGGMQLGLGGSEVVMRTLDSFGFTDIALLKVDAEGAEPLVLWGARELIRRCRPIVLFERNQKTVTETMRAMMNIPDEVRTFEVEQYVKDLGYSEPIKLPHALLLLLPQVEWPSEVSKPS